MNSATLDTGKSYPLRIVLPQFCKFEKPGVYTLTCKHRLDIGVEEGAPIPPDSERRPQVSTVFKVTVPAPSSMLQPARSAADRCM